jgi:hypothetical protein
MRISTTVLESFRLYRSADWMEEADLIATIRGDFVPSPAMELGKAFHAVLEEPDQHRQPDGSYIAYGMELPGRLMDEALKYVEPAGVHEVKAETPVRAFGEIVTVVGKADALLGGTVVEYKTKLGTFSWDRYEESSQWRFYCWLFGAFEVRYHVFVLDDKRGLYLRGVESFTFSSYPAVAEYCSILLDEFLAYVKMRGLEPWLADDWRDRPKANAKSEALAQ